MKRKEFCNELINQFNYYAKNDREPGICLLLLKLLGCITKDKLEFSNYTEKIKNQELKKLIMLYYLAIGDGL